MGMHVSEHRLMDAVRQICSASEMLEERTDRNGSYTACLARSRKRQEIFRLMMQDAGWQITLADFDVGKDAEKQKAQNVHVSWKTISSPRFLFGCHGDYCAGEGANDNATGMAACVELARQLAGTEAAMHTRFASFDMEERGLLGSKARVATETAEMPERMVNIDAIGAGDLFVMQNAEVNLSLINDLWDASNDAEEALYAIDAKRIGISSDHIPFWQKGIPSTSILAYGTGAHEILAQQTDAKAAYEELMKCSNANKPTDVIAAVDPSNMVATVRILLQWIANSS